MLSLTKQERMVLIFLLVVSLSGAVIRFVFDKSPALRAGVLYLDDQSPLRRVDLNRATAADLQTLPGVGPALAGEILSYRARHGAFHSPDDLRQVPGVGPKSFSKIFPYLKSEPRPTPPQKKTRK